MERPKCEVPGCENMAQNTNTSANPRWRKSKWVREEFGAENGYVCQSCHGKRYDIGDWIYKKYRKTYCENSDGRIANTFCTATITHPNLQLDVDHINGDSANNEPENLQTLCSNCHRIKTHLNEDWKTPGRGTHLKLKKESNEKSD